MRFCYFRGDFFVGCAYGFLGNEYDEIENYSLNRYDCRLLGMICKFHKTSKILASSFEQFFGISSDSINESVQELTWQHMSIHIGVKYVQILYSSTHSHSSNKTSIWKRIEFSFRQYTQFHRRPTTCLVSHSIEILHHGMNGHNTSFILFLLNLKLINFHYDSPLCSI